ncbi:hypothetical protein [Halalkalibacter urbisdiaboli]|nr:hypothetical protein [Halalkalibacter urbisdiaboli]
MDALDPLRNFATKDLSEKALLFFGLANFHFNTNELKTSMLK